MVIGSTRSRASQFMKCASQENGGDERGVVIEDICVDGVLMCDVGDGGLIEQSLR